jgi:ATP-dependent Clp protease ATP-binding subunit ClpB
LYHKSGFSSRIAISCLHKNSPVLIGKPGVGKTAIVEELARRIVSGDVPKSLKDCKIISLDLGTLITGARYRGEYEERLRSVLIEVAESSGKTILFIDELHNFIGTGTAENAINTSLLLKPMLSRGELYCIGATTIEGYQNIERNSSIERLFQPIHVNEPSVEDTISILRGLKERYEVHHDLKISDSALVTAAILSNQYIPNRFLPDKAIDLIDRAAAKLKMEITSKPEQLDEIDRKVLQLEMERLSLNKAISNPARERLQKIEKELADLKQEQLIVTAQWQLDKTVIDDIKIVKEQIDKCHISLRQAERDYDLNRAAELKYSKLIELDRRLETAEVQLAQSNIIYEPQEVSELDIAEIVAQWIGIAVAEISISSK